MDDEGKGTILDRITSINNQLSEKLKQEVDIRLKSMIPDRDVKESENKKNSVEKKLEKSLEMIENFKGDMRHLI